MKRKEQALVRQLEKMKKTVRQTLYIQLKYHSRSRVCNCHLERIIIAVDSYDAQLTNLDNMQQLVRDGKIDEVASSLQSA